MAVKSNDSKSMINMDVKRAQQNNDMFVVGIGASAGGLDALQEFFDHIPLNTGMSFCVVQHLSPDFKSLMDELLGRHSKLKISTVQDGELILPNRIYLNPNHSSVIIKEGKFKLVPKEEKGTINLPIDLFLHSLAQEYGEKSIGIILSGTGTDGSRGIKTIKEVGGTIMVQSPLSAQFDGMPNTAINTGYAEYVNTPKGLADEVVKFPSKPSFYGEINKGSTPSETEIVFNKILDEIHKNTGVDFKLYKNNTLVRRLEKRMGVLNISEITDYHELIKKNKQEPSLLMTDFFIGVTSFFRDKLAWQVLKNEVLPAIFKNKDANDVVRVWSVGCSTGEEAFTMAMLLDEYVIENNLKNDYKIFATDIDRRAIEIASKGEYIINEIRDLSQNRLEKYFIRVGDKYQVNKKIRGKIVFSAHNIIKNPPFIKTDLISCRNLLIYLLPKTQQKIYQHFQFSLNQNGYLFLGNSENLGEAQENFEVLDAKWRVYICRNKTNSLPYLRQGDQLERVELIHPRLHVTTRSNERKTLTDTLFLNHIVSAYAPKCIFIDEDYNILYTNGDLKSFLNIPQGMFQFNLLKMLEDKLAAMIRNGVRRLNEEKKEIIFTNIQALLKNHNKVVNLTFSKLQKDANITCVTFDEKDIDIEKTLVYDQYELDEFSKQRIEDLEVELKSKQEELQYVIEEIETSNEELQASNEELQAANEELQGTNEELQSVNEELYTVNTELQSKNKELIDLNNDMNNLLSSTNIGTLFLDNKLKIRKFTPALKKHFNLEVEDIGRSINNFSNRFQNLTEKEFSNNIKEVVKTGKEIEMEVIDHNNATFIKKIMPFVSDTNQIDGVVITYVDVTNLKKIETELLEQNDKLLALTSELEQIIDHFPGLVFYKDDKNNFLKVNQFVADVYQLNKEAIEGKSLFELNSHEHAQKYWEDDLEVIRSGTSKLNIIESWTTEESEKWVRTSKILIKNPIDKSTNILGVSVDITELKNIQRALENSNEELSQFAYVASHDLQEPLNTVIGFSSLLKDSYGAVLDEEGNEYIDLILSSTSRMKELIKGVLDYSRIEKNSIMETFSPQEVIQNVLHDLQVRISENHSVINLNNIPETITGYSINFRILMQNLISNAMKFNTSETPLIEISYFDRKNYHEFRVKDNGIGIDAKFNKKIFEVFQRLHTDSAYRGTGIGLAHCKKVVDMHKGSIWVESEINKGSTFIFTILKGLKNG